MCLPARSMPTTGLPHMFPEKPAISPLLQRHDRARGLGHNPDPYVPNPVICLAEGDVVLFQLHLLPHSESALRAGTRPLSQFCITIPHALTDDPTQRPSLCSGENHKPMLSPVFDPTAHCTLGPSFPIYRSKESCRWPGSNIL